MAEKIRLTKSIMVSLNAVVKAIAMTLSSGVTTCRHCVEILDVEVCLEEDFSAGAHELGDEVGACRLCSTGLSHRHGKYIRHVKLVGKYGIPTFHGRFEAECDVWLIRRTGVKGGESRFVHQLRIDLPDKRVSAFFSCLYDVSGKMSMILRSI